MWLSPADGRPVVPFGYCRDPSTPRAGLSNSSTQAELWQLQSVAASASLDPAALYDHGNRTVAGARVAAWLTNLDTLASVGSSALSVLLGNGKEAGPSGAGHQSMPSWAEDAFPGLTTAVGKTHFYGYDIDNPGAAAIWDQVLAAVVPAASEHPAVMSWDLANEPGFESAVSNYTLAKFSAYLEATYGGDVEALNTAWDCGSSAPFSGFDDPRLRLGMGNVTFSPRQLVDWATFNQLRVSEWYEYLCGRVRHYAAPGAPPPLCNVKTSNANAPLGANHGDGMDRVRQLRRLGAAGCDTRNAYLGAHGHWTKTHMPFPQWPASAYSMDWVAMAGSYDFMASVSPTGAPVLDTEWHPFSTVHYRNAELPALYADAVTQLAVLHGVTGILTWYWARDADWSPDPAIPSEFGGADFAFSIMTQPIAFAAAQQAMAKVNALVETYAALAAAPRQVALLYSEASAIASVWPEQGGGAFLDTQLAAYSLAHFVGANVGFVPDIDLDASRVAQARLAPGRGAEPAREDAPPRPAWANAAGLPTGTELLLVPAVSHITDAAVAAVQALVNSSAPQQTASRAANGVRNDNLSRAHSASSASTVAVSVSVVLVGNSTTRNLTFAYTPAGRVRDASSLAWLHTLPFVDVGGVGGANAAAFGALEAAVGPLITAPALRCVPPAAFAAALTWAEGDRAKRWPAVFGVHCRAAQVSGAAAAGAPGDSGVAVTVTNYGNTTTPVALLDSVLGSVVTQAWDPWLQRTVALDRGTLTLAPLQSALLIVQSSQQL